MDDSTFGSTGTIPFNDWNALGKVIDRLAPDAFHTISAGVVQLESGTTVPDTCYLGTLNNNLNVGGMTAGIGGYGERTG